MAGLLTLTKQGRKLYYTLTGQQNAPLTGQVPGIYISESLTCDGTYTVYSHEYEGEDTYLTETTADGFIVQ